jgi:hypothetical protein
MTRCASTIKAVQPGKAVKSLLSAVSACVARALGIKKGESCESKYGGRQALYVRRCTIPYRHVLEIAAASQLGGVSRSEPTSITRGEDASGGTSGGGSHLRSAARDARGGVDMVGQAPSKPPSAGPRTVNMYGRDMQPPLATDYASLATSHSMVSFWVSMPCTGARTYVIACRFTAVRLVRLSWRPATPPGTGPAGHVALRGHHGLHGDVPLGPASHRDAVPQQALLAPG